MRWQQVVKSFRRKHTRQGRLAMLGKVLLVVDRAEGRARASLAVAAAMGDYDRELWLDARPALRSLHAVGRVRRVARLLAELAAATPYTSTQECNPSPAKHTPLDGNEQRRMTPRVAIDMLIDMLGARDRKLLGWRYGLFGQNRMPVGAIARKLGCSRQWVAKRLRALTEQIALSEYAQEYVTGSFETVDCE